MLLGDTQLEEFSNPLGLAYLALGLLPDGPLQRMITDAAEQHATAGNPATMSNTT